MTSRRKWLLRGALALGAAVLALAAWAAHLRYVRKNFHAVVEGQVYRSAQPTPEELRNWVRKYGLQSVLTLQGTDGNKTVMEQRGLAASLNLQCGFNYMSSDRLPAIHELKGLIRYVEGLPRPLLIHCRGGVDRTGLASVVAALAIGGLDYEQAKSQLSLKYLYLRRGRNVNDLLDDYEAYRRRVGGGLGGWKEFKAWAEDVYKPSYYHALIEVPSALSCRPAETVSVQARITNGSDAVLPLSDPDRRFDLIALVRTDSSYRWTENVWGRAALPRQDLPPGGTLTVTLSLRIPAEPGTTVLCFDLEEVGRDRFGIYDSPMPNCTVTVK